MYTLETDDVVIHRNLRVTTPARTLIDLGDVVASSVTERAMEWCLRHQQVELMALGRIREALAHPRIPSASRCAAGAEARGCAGDRERRRDPLRATGPPSEISRSPTSTPGGVAGRRYRLDFAWPTLRLAVEIDGGSVHGPGALARDLFRQNQMLLDGWLILRFTWGQLVHEQPAVEADLRSGWLLRGEYRSDVSRPARPTGCRPGPGLSARHWVAGLAPVAGSVATGCRLGSARRLGAGLPARLRLPAWLRVAGSAPGLPAEAPATTTSHTLHRDADLS